MPGRHDVDPHGMAEPLADDVRARVRAALGRLPEGLDVHADGGHVMLRGSVDSDDERERVGRAAAETPGVNSVTNELVLVAAATER